MCVASTHISVARATKSVRTGALTTAYFAALVALGISVGSLGPTVPSLAEQTHVGLGAISYVFTFRSLGYVLGSVRGGKLFDQTRGNSVMATTTLVAALGVLTLLIGASKKVARVVM